MQTNMLAFATDWRKIKIEDCELRVRTIDSLTKAGVKTLGELEGLEWQDARCSYGPFGLGMVSFHDIKEMLGKIPGSKENLFLVRKERREALSEKVTTLRMQLLAAEMELSQLSD